MIEAMVRYVLLFFAYSFLGWCLEVAYAACCEGRFVNRGFLNGPVCPIYGFGVIGVVLLLEPAADNLPLLFVGSALVTTLIEFIGGYVLEKVFHTRWWDYSDMPLNLKGYVCLLFSLIWGAICVIVVRWVHPMVLRMIGWTPWALRVILTTVFAGVMIVDLAATVMTIRKLAARLTRLTEMAAEIHALSDEIGQHISDGTLSAKRRLENSERVQRWAEIKAETNERMEQGRERIEETVEATTERWSRRREEVRERLEARRERLRMAKERFAALLEEHSFGQKRLMNAFPHMTSLRNQEALDALRESIARRRERKNKVK